MYNFINVFIGHFVDGPFKNLKAAKKTERKDVPFPMLIEEIKVYNDLSQGERFMNLFDSLELPAMSNEVLN